MHPYFYIGEHGPFFMYGLLGSIALAAFLMRIYFSAEHFGIQPERMLVIATIAFFVGLLGARLLDFFATYGTEFYSTDWNGGYAWYGGPLLVIPYLLIAFWWTRIPAWRGLDVFFMILPLAHAIARIGCFLAGCCYGKPTNSEFGVTFPPEAIDAPVGVKIHPTQLYEAVGLMLIFFLLTYLSQFRKFSGICFAGYFVLYGLLRFVIEIFRGDDVERGFVHLLSYEFSVSQVIAVATILAGILVLIIRAKRNILEAASAK